MRQLLNLHKEKNRYNTVAQNLRMVFYHIIPSSLEIHKKCVNKNYLTLCSHKVCETAKL